ncbi:MAG: hypothetical protein R3346_04900 [Candidatus Spechtbacterales bacterium]|nr:hypothetical protein [Candidatus Spechtbacterales bacterium]
MKNKNFKKYILAISIVILLFVGTFEVAGAEEALYDPTKLESPLTCTTIDDCFNRWTNMLIVFATPIYTVMLSIAGFYFILGGSTPAKRQKAKDILKYSTIGFLIVSFARGMVSFLLILV